jgi:putative transposase
VHAPPTPRTGNARRAQARTHGLPGKPWQNGTDESFNGKFRDECLSLEWFRNRIDAKWVIEKWRREYNEVRPHSSLGYLTPVEFKSQPQIKSGCLTEGSAGVVLQ